MALITLSGYECDRCGHRWFPRQLDRLPLVCPKCKSPYWNRPRGSHKSAADHPRKRKDSMLQAVRSSAEPRTKASATLDVFTIGYEGRTALDFVRLLREHRVSTLVDIRAVPMSRRPDFRKKALAALLDDAGIRYYPVQALGTPAPLRDALKETGNYVSFFRAFNTHLRKQHAALEDLSKLVSGERCALMCFEREASRCHRSAVASYLKSKLSCDVVDL
jgi:hypothetical protein